MYRPDVEDQRFEPVDFDRVIGAANAIANASIGDIGQPDRDLIFAFRNPNAFGLGGNQSGSDDADEHIEILEERGNIPVRSSVVHDSMRAWLEALKSVAAVSNSDVASILLARPEHAPISKIQDPEALIHRLILSPACQLN